MRPPISPNALNPGFDVALTGLAIGVSLVDGPPASLLNAIEAGDEFGVVVDGLDWLFESLLTSGRGFALVDDDEAIIDSPGVLLRSMVIGTPFDGACAAVC